MRDWLVTIHVRKSKNNLIDMRKILFISFALILCAACKHSQDINTKDNKAQWDKQSMESLNRYMIAKDRERILNYIERKDLSMEENQMGIWYSIENEGENVKIKDNDRVIIEYECSLLDGSLCYSSEDDGYKIITVGKNEFGAGLDYGLKMLGRGGEALFIVPSFMAFGLKGDGNKIPSRSVLVFSVKARDVN